MSTAHEAAEATRRRKTFTCAPFPRRRPTQPSTTLYRPIGRVAEVLARLSFSRTSSVFKEPNAPRRLPSFPDLLGALGGGAAAHALVDLAGCQKLENKKAVGAGPRIVERIPFVLNEYFGKSVVGNPAAFLATSHASLHLRPEGIASRYAKLRISATGDASVLIMENKPVALEPIESAEYTCPLATTASGTGVSLFGF